MSEPGRPRALMSEPAKGEGTPVTAPARSAPGTRRLLARGVDHAYALRTVVEGVDFELEAGRTLALVGPSGCGKTTLAHLCAGLLRVQTGELVHDFQRPAMMFQQPRLLPWKTALDNIALGLKAMGVGRRQRRVQAAVAGREVQLDDEALARFPHQLSGGMQSRVALARALVLDPDLLLLDEPFSALDVGLKAQAHARLVQAQAGRGLAVLLITHDLMEAVRLAHTVLVMAADPGRIAQRLDLGTPPAARDDALVHHTTAQLLQSAGVRTSFGLPPLADAPLAAGAAASARVIELAPHVPRRQASC